MQRATFETRDIALAAYLVLEGFSLKGSEHIQAGKMAFQFDDTPGREERVLRFLNRKARVEPSSFVEQIKSLKAVSANR